MGSFSERLAVAKAAPRNYKDVPVLVDGVLSRELEALQEQLESLGESTDARMGVKSPAEEIEERMQAIRDAARDSVEIFRFTALPGNEWARITSKWPPRPDVPIDRHYGFDYDSVCEESAEKSGARLVDGELVPLIVEAATPDNPNPLNEWRDLFATISGSDFADIRDAQWALNEHEPRERLNVLVKDFGAATRSEQI